MIGLRQVLVINVPSKKHKAEKNTPYEQSVACSILILIFLFM